MSYFVTCPDCGCNLDPGEKCDCKSQSQAIPLRNGRTSNAFVYTNAEKHSQSRALLGTAQTHQRTA